MESGKSSEAGHNYKGITDSLHEAEFIFRTIFSDNNEDKLGEGILLWLGKTKDPFALELFLKLPELLQEYSIIDFLNPGFSLPEVSDKDSIRKVGLAACMLYMIIGCWELFGENLNKYSDSPWPSLDKKYPHINQLKDIMNMVSLGDFQHELGISLISIIGRPYYELFINKLESFGNEMTPEEAKIFESDPALKDHMQLILWFGLMRFFLDAVYLYFGKENKSL